MKLIIDIPEEVKNRLCFGVTYAEDIQTVCEALHNGTPLEDIKAEINALSEYHWDKGDFDIDVVNGMINEFLDIIDKHIGRVKNDKRIYRRITSIT